MPFRRRDPSLTLYCFSPAVILATFLIEAFLAVYVWFRYRASRFGRLATVFLALLALFQFSELMICRGGPSELWVRVAFVATAFLPIIALDFIGLLTRDRRALGLGYAVATAFSIIMLLRPGTFADAACTGRFVAFSGGDVAFDLLYSAYYLIALLWGAGLTLQAIRKRTGDRTTLIWLFVGYLSFMLPTIGLYALVAASRPGLPSILCGFAVFAALITAFKILPAAVRSRR